jgi:hypothetical protein
VKENQFRILQAILSSIVSVVPTGGGGGGGGGGGVTPPKKLEKGAQRLKNSENSFGPFIFKKTYTPAHLPLANIFRKRKGAQTFEFTPPPPPPKDISVGTSLAVVNCLG